MSEPAPPIVPEGTAEDEGRLTPERIECLLADFRAWLTEAPSGAAPTVEPPPDLHTLLGQMIAVRQEVTLQTRAVRAQTEQNAETLEQLAEAVEELQRARAPQQSPDDLVKPLLKVLVDVHDALSLALREAQRVQDTVLPLLDVLNLGGISLAGVHIEPLAETGRPLLARLFGVHAIAPQVIADWQEQARAALEKSAVMQVATQAEQQKEARERVKQLLVSLVAGYRMGLQRIERALAQNALEAIPAVGEIFDPERMEVLEAADNSGRPAGEVLEEVRRGYLWRGRMFRYAQVRVARS